MKKSDPSELYFSGARKPRMSQISQKSPRQYLKNFDIEKESMKLYSFPLKSRRVSEMSLKNSSILSVNMEDKVLKTELNSKKINVFKDQSSPLMSSLEYLGHNNFMSPIPSTSENRAFSRKLSLEREKHKSNRSESNSLNAQKERTIFTSSNNHRFKENVRVLNKIEELLPDPQFHEYSFNMPKKKKNKSPISNFGFITQRFEEMEDPNEPIILRENCETRCFFRKYNFIYFHISIKNKLSPLKTSFNVEEGDRSCKFKVYASSKNKTPNKFNSDFEIEVGFFIDFS